MTLITYVNVGCAMLGDLKSKRLIVLKGCLFLVCLLVSAAALFLESPSLRTTLLIGILIWASARFYYFLFYVLHQYVDPSLKYAGLWALLRSRRNRNDQATDSEVRK